MPEPELPGQPGPPERWLSGRQERSRQAAAPPGAINEVPIMDSVNPQEALAGTGPGRQPLYVSLPGVKVMLRWLLERVIAGEAMQSFHEALRAKLDGGQVNALAEARQALEKAQRAQQRLGRLLHEVDCDDGVLEQQYLAARENVLRLEAQVRTLTEGVQRLNQEAIAQQLTVDLSRVVDQFLSDSESPARTRTVLQRVFPSIVLVGKPERFAAIFEVTASPGAIVAAASGTAEVATDISTKFRLLLRTSGARNPTWSVEQLD